MASSRPSSSQPELSDLALTVEAFEVMNAVCIEIRLRSSLKGGLADFQMTALAHPSAHQIGDLPPLASVSRSYLAMNVKSLDAAVFQLLYALDGQLASAEFEGTLKKEA